MALTGCSDNPSTSEEDEPLASDNPRATTTAEPDTAEGEDVESNSQGGDSFEIGDEFKVSDWTITITGVGERAATIPNGSFIARADGEFMPVELEATYDLDRNTFFIVGDIVALDDQDREFTYVANATPYGFEDGDGAILKEVQAGDTVEGPLYFDVAADAEIVALEFSSPYHPEPVRVSLE